MVIIIDFAPQFISTGRGTQTNIRFTVPANLSEGITVGFMETQEMRITAINSITSQNRISGKPLEQNQLDTIASLAVRADNLRTIKTANIRQALNRIEDYVSMSDIEIMENFFNRLSQYFLVETGK